MGKAGARPKPTAIKIANGNPGKRPLNLNEPKPSSDTPTVPDWLNDDAKDKWNELVPQLQEMNVLAHIDGDALATYCQVWSRWRTAEETIQKYGATYPVTDADGKLKHLQQLPQVNIAKGLLQVLNRLQQEFGLTPSARSSLDITKASGYKEPSIDDFISDAPRLAQR